MMKKILLLVTGMSPQIVTETVYGLAVKPTNGQPWLPSEVHVISTTSGLTQVRASLFKEGYFCQLLHDYALPSIHFDESCLHGICDSSGQMLPDLKTPEDNELAANTICEMVRQFTSNPDTELHVSIAGGRKTMGFYAGYALSLYGRAQDRMSHVLVSSEFESSREFFYPAPIPRTTFVSQNGKTERQDAYEADVWLADIPFVRLRQHLPEKTLLHKATFSEVIQRLALATGDIRLQLNCQTLTIIVNSLECRLSPREFAFYLWFARRKLANKDNIMAPVIDNPDPELAMDFLAVYRQCRGELHSIEDTLVNGMEKAFFEQAKSRLKADLIKYFGEAVFNKIGVLSMGRNKGFALPATLTKEQIDIIGGEK